MRIMLVRERISDYRGKTASHAAAMDMEMLAAFTKAPEDYQLAFIRSLEDDELRELHNAWLEWAERSEYKGSLNVWGMMLSDAGLRRIREETYTNQIRPLLTTNQAEKERFISSLDRESRKALEKLLDRYACECGRSNACSETEAMVRASLLEGRR